MASGINQECYDLLYLYKAICYAINNVSPSIFLEYAQTVHASTFNLGMFIVLQYCALQEGPSIGSLSSLLLQLLVQFISFPV